MAQKGSKRNLYLGSEYINICETSEWRGGWVLYEAANIKCYITQHRTEYRERDGEILGGEYRPYTYAVYDEMKGLEIWEGGWVLPNPSNPDTRGTTYHTAGDEIFGVINLIPLGEEENPFPIDVYNEMLMNEIWFGGWVLYLDGNKEYIGSMYGGSSGSGCGCGSGGGCGCGSGGGNIIPGFGYVDIVVYGTLYQITVSWEYGRAGEVPIRATIDDEEWPGLTVTWEGSYTMKVSYQGSHVLYTVPEIYRE